MNPSKKVWTVFSNILTNLKVKRLNNYFAKAKEYIKVQEYDNAQKYFQKIASILEKKPTHIPVSKNYLAEAYLGLGAVFEAKGKSSSATDYYIKVLENTQDITKLSDSAIVLLGDYYSKRKNKSVIATKIYLRFIKLKSRADITSRVYAVLENVCYIDETQPSDIRKQVIALNQRVLSVNTKAEWAHYYLGIGLFIENNVPDARSHLSLAIKINPQRPLSYYWLGKTYVASGRLDASAICFLKFNKLVPSDAETQKQAEAYFYIGSSLINEVGGFSEEVNLSVKENTNKIEEALSCFKHAVLKNSNNASYFFSLAQTLSLLKKQDQAIKAYLKASKIDNKNSEYLYFLARELKKTGKLDEAKEAVCNALKLSEQGQYHQLLAKLHLLTDNFKEAELHCRKVFDQLTNCTLDTFCILIPALYHQAKYNELVEACEISSLTIKVSQKLKDIVFYIARAYSITAKFEKAIVWYKKLTEYQERPDALYYLGCALANIGNLDEAAAVFSKVIVAGDQYSALAHLQCGHICFRAGQTKEAASHYQKAYSIAPKNIDILYSLGLFYYNTARYKKTLRYLDDLLSINPNHTLAHYAKGLIYERQKNFIQAISEYELAMSGKSSSPESCLRLGIVYCKKSDYQKAIEYLQKVKGLDQEHDTILFYLGLAKFFNKQYAEALVVWDELYRSYPDDSKLEMNIYLTHYLLGCDYIAESKYSKAISEWEKYLKRYSQDTKTKGDLAELYFRAGVYSIKKGDVNKAKGFLLKAVKLGEDNPTYPYYLGLCDFKAGNYTECIAQFNNLLHMQQDDPRVKYHLGLSLLRAGESEKGIHILNELVSGNNNGSFGNLAAWIMANEHIKEGQYDKAIPMLEVVI